MYSNSTGMATFDRGDAVYACRSAAVDDHSYSSALYSAATTMASKVDKGFDYINNITDNITDRLKNVEGQVATLRAIMATADLKRNKPTPRTFIFSNWKAFEEVYNDSM